MIHGPLHVRFASRDVPRFRRGGAYIAVLGIGLLVVTVGVGALASARVRARGSKLSVDAAEAREHARSAIELGRAIIATTPAWRTSRANGEWVASRAIGNGTLSLRAQNPNGSLDRSDLDPVILTGTGAVGQASQTLSVQLDAARVPLTCLAVPMSSGGLITLNTATVSSASGPVTSNAGITSVLSTINCDVEACATIIGTGFRGKTTAGVDARQLPASNVADSYIAAGATIPISSLPTTLLVRYLSNTLLGPRSNPYGAANAAGIYIIDCQNQKIVIENCRIVGTLVIKNPGLGSEVRGKVQWSPAVANYPCLLAMGDFAINIASTSLSETTIGYNLNPSGTPYPFPSGTTNATITDSFPSVIDGLVYISGNATTSNDVGVDVLIAGGAVTSSGNLKLDYDAGYQTSPPPGFYSVQMQVSQGSWRRIVGN